MYVLPRLGVLPSDVSVAGMTDEQWLWMHHATHRMERDRYKLLVSTLGLDLIKPAGSDEPVVTPLVLLMGTPELLVAAKEQADGEAAAERALHDEAYEEFIQELMKNPDAGIGDAEPVVNDEDDLWLK